MIDLIRILIVEDHAIMRDGLSMIFSVQDDMEVVGVAGDGPSAIDLFVQCRPNLVLVDLRLPGMPGTEVIRRIAAVSPDVRFLVLTTYDGDADISESIRAGASGYLLKGMSKEDLLAAIRAVHLGQRWLPTAIATRLAEHFLHEQLSAREMQVLRLVAQGLQNREIGEALNVTEFTAKFHVKSILAKLGARDRTQAVTIAYERGFLHLPVN